MSDDVRQDRLPIGNDAHSYKHSTVHAHFHHLQRAAAISGVEGIGSLLMNPNLAADFFCLFRQWFLVTQRFFFPRRQIVASIDSCGT